MKRLVAVEPDGLGWAGEHGTVPQTIKKEIVTLFRLTRYNEAEVAEDTVDFIVL